MAAPAHADETDEPTGDSEHIDIPHIQQASDVQDIPEGSATPNAQEVPKDSEALGVSTIPEFWEYEPMPELEPRAEVIVSPRQQFRAGRMQFRLSGGIELRGVTIPQLLSVIDGWYTTSATLDVGLVNFGKVTVGVGVEGAYARQPLLNPMLGARRWLGDAIPDWVPRILIPIPLNPGAAADWKWFPRDRTVAGRLHVHLNGVPGRPYLVAALGQSRYRLDVENRDNGRTGQVRANMMVGQIGAGGTRTLKSNLIINGEILLSRRLINPLATRFEFDPDDDTDDLAILGRVRPPSAFRFSIGVGYRL
jgi:hypothetical protein